MRLRVLVTTASLFLALALCASPPARADYTVQVGPVCQHYTTLAAAIAAGRSTVFVQDTNLEAGVTIVPRDLRLRSASGPCLAGGAGRIELAAGVASRVLEILAGTTVDKLELTVEGVAISGGNIAGDGGTIYLQRDSTLRLIGGASVANGVASGRGGCLYADHARLLMETGTTIHHCTASTDGGGIALRGGHGPAVYHKVVSLDDNVAVAGHGGGAWIDGAAVCMFDARSNHAALDGGAAYVTDDSGDAAWLGAFDLEDLNTAGRDGGGIYAEGAQSRVDAAAELASNSAAGNGGGVRATAGATVYLDPGAQLRGNRAEGDGGGVHGDGLATIEVGAVFDTVAIGDGEGYHGECGNAAGAIAIEGNQAGYDAAGVEVDTRRDGGGVFLSAATLDGSAVAASARLRIAGNVASHEGGGVAGFVDAVITLAHTDLLANLATRGDGGGVLADGGTAANLDDCQLVDGVAGRAGGGLAVDGASATLADVEVRSNDAPLGGGLALNAGATVDVTWASLTDNHALVGGGAAVALASTLTMVQGDVVANTADAGGGLAAVAATIVLGETAPACPVGDACVELRDNVASGVLGRGGAVVLSGAGAQVELRRTRVVGNLADQGAAVWMDRVDHTLYLHNSAVLDNHGNAGLVAALAVSAGSVVTLHSTIAHNDVGMNLGTTATVSMDSCLVVQNLVDILGLVLGATATGDCNGVQFAATAAALGGVDNVDTAPATASVSALTGAPINTADIVDQCSSTLLPIDLRGRPRPVGGSSDRGAYERQ